MSKPRLFQGYGDISFIDMAYSASYLRRWHMVRVVRESSLSDHSYRVAQTFRCFFKRWQDNIFAKPVLDSEKLEKRYLEKELREKSVDFDRIKLIGLEIALDHDLLETLAGDVPSHVKKGEATVYYDKVEEEIEKTVVDHEYFFKSQKGDDLETQLAKTLVKLADEAESLVYAHYNQGLGPLCPDPKRTWITERYDVSFMTRVQKLNPFLFTASFGSSLVKFVVDEHMGINPQHA